MIIKAFILNLIAAQNLKKKTFTILFIFTITFSQALQAQSPRVPAIIDFAGMKLKLSEQVKRDIQSDVDALYRNEKYFKIKVDRVNLYMPIIERILKEEKVPDDFKYLVIQESSLISDAVSTSNAVGFWQFKQDAGEEVGLKINGNIDERLNIVASTRGATAYLKKHNSYFKNWLYSLLAYNMGRGGARSVVDPKYFGAEKMDLDKNTHWYILKFLAHKVAFENALGKNLQPELMLVEYTEGTNKSLKDISRELEVEMEQLEFYNKWLKRGTIPADKAYTVIVPVPASQPDLIAVNEQNTDEEPAVVLAEQFLPTPNKYPLIEGDLADQSNPLLVLINGRPGIVSREGDDLSTLATQGGIRLDKFKKINDLKASHRVKPGQYYYLKAKRNNAPVHKHTVQPGETLWDISQMYGIKEAKILRKNRMASASALKPGLVLWLRFIRPSKEPVSFQPVVAYQQIEEKDDGRKTPASLTEAPLKNDLNKINKGSGSGSGNIINELPDPPHENEKTASETTEEIVIRKSTTNTSKTLVVTTEDEQVAEVKNSMDTVKINEDKNIKDKPTVTVSEQPNEIAKQSRNEMVKEAENFEAEEITFIQTENNQATELNIQDQHVVKQGETLFGIARNYAISLQDLAKWNNVNFDEGIKIGQVLSLKSPIIIAKEESSDVRKITENVQEQYIVHKVAAGETLYKIAREHNVTIKEVMEWNKKTDFNVALGEVIKIKKLIVNE